jgi:hypothetical protein
MKKNTLIIIAIMLSSIALYAQEDNTTSTAMVGGMFVVKPPNSKFSSDKDGIYGADLFFRKHFNFQANNNYLTLNAGFVHYKENNRIRDDYTLSLGLINIMNANHSKFSFYNEIDFGVLYRKENAYTDDKDNFHKSDNGVGMMIGINNGVIYHLSKHINWDIGLKFQYNPNDMFHTSVGVGITYLFLK